MCNNSNLSDSTPPTPSVTSIPTILLFENKFKSGAHTGQLIIWGLDLPYNDKFSPLDKIWSSTRKRIAEEFGIQVTGVFHQRKTGEYVGDFIVNMATVRECDYDALQAKFRESFEVIMAKFKSILENWAFAPSGLAAYETYVKQAGNDVDPSVCNQVVEDFLISIGAKTPKDLKEREKKQERLKKRNNAFLEFVELIRKFATSAEDGEQKTSEQS